MLEYDIDPHDYLAAVHDIDYSAVEANTSLGAAIAALPGRKHIFTNGDVAHAERTLQAIGIALSVFDSVFDIVAAEFEPKPRRGAYDRFVRQSGIDPVRAAMFEDLPRNLAVPKEMGMTTVLIRPRDGTTHTAEAWEFDGHADEHVDHVSDDITGFLTALFPLPR